MTEEFKPFGYTEKDEIKGVCVDIVRVLLKTVDHPDNILVYPWDRAYQEAQKLPGRILFSVGRNEAREHLFKWVGPLISNVTYFYKKRGSDVHIKTLEDAREIKSIAVRANYFAHTLLKEKGFQNLVVTRDELIDLRMLAAGRANLIAAGELGLKSYCEQTSLDCSQIENTGVVVYDSKLYLAFSKDTPQKEIARWQNALDKVKNRPIYSKIISQYIH